MGKSFNTGLLTNGIAQDSSNNVGIGGAANASYKLAVTGASLFSSSVTANGLVSANAKLEVNDANGIPIRFQDISAAITGQTAGYIGMSTSAFSGNNGDLVLYPRTSATSRILLMGGNVGIGTSSPSYKLDVHNGSDFDIRLRDTSLGGTVGILFETANDFSGTSQAYIKGIGAGNSGVSQLIFGTAGASGDTTATERMRITSGGSVGIGTSNPFGVNSSLLALVGSGSIYNFLNIQDTVNQSGATYIQFLNSAGGGTGQIVRVGTTNAVAYNTTSDYRLKEDFKEIKGLDKVLGIKVYDFKWKDNDARMDGVIAHELQEILPYAVTGNKDDLNEDGTMKYQGVDYSKLVPILVKAIQELSAKVTALENK